MKEAVFRSDSMCVWQFLSVWAGMKAGECCIGKFYWSRVLLELG